MFKKEKASSFGMKDGANPEGDKTAKEVKAQLDAIAKDLKEAAAKSTEEIKANGDMTRETKTKVDELLTKQAEFVDRLVELEQKATRRNAASEPQKTIGQQFVESQGYKNFSEKRDAPRFRMTFKAVTTLTSITTGTGGVGDAVETQRLNVMVTPPQRRMTIRDLITPGRTNSNAIEYVKESGFQNMAATVAEGGPKPQSDLSFDLVSSSVVTIAHWVKASTQILSDAPMLESYIDGRLRYGLEYVEEQQLLNGSGAPNNLNGIYTQATAYSEPAGAYPDQPTGFTVPTPIDILRLAILQAELAEYPVTGIVLNPSNWAAIELLKDADGRYIIGNPVDGTTPRLWGRTVVATQAMAEDKFLVGAFKLGAQVFDREDAAVQVSTEDADNFTKNLVTIRAEERLTLAVYRTEAFVKGDLGLST